jgi:hypothetical protein
MQRGGSKLYSGLCKGVNRDGRVCIGVGCWGRVCRGRVALLLTETQHEVDGSGGVGWG